jgi:hypothetical protein
MGRYYNGDINGKFWFGVQSSVAAERFGTTAIEPNYVEFSFDEDNLESINAEIKKIEDNLGENKEKLDKFFTDKMSYNNDMLIDAGIDHKMLEDYADLDLGIKIRDCVMQQGHCNFEAEL